MAFTLLARNYYGLLRTAVICEPIQLVRTKTRNPRPPTRKKKNPFVKRFTDFIKHACITLVKYERVQTTKTTAYRLQQYGNLLITFTQRRRPPPDLCMIKNGFLLHDHEVKERLTKRIIQNRSVKNIVREPQVLPEDEYVERCREEASNILLHDEAALEKLYGELAERYRGINGEYIKVTEMPWPKNSNYPQMAYVELINNGKPPLPKLPEMVRGRLKTFPRDTGHHFINTV